MKDPTITRLGKLQQGDSPPIAEAAYLGPATVIGTQGHDLLVQLEDSEPQQVIAIPSFTFPYEPQPGDSLLVLGRQSRFYAVGVLSASRPQSLRFQGDVNIHAVEGKLTLSSDQAVELKAPRVTIRAGVLRTLANSLVEKTDDLRRWVRGLLSIRAGESRRIVDGEDSTRCQNSTTLAKETVKIDGDQLHLGH